MANTTSRVPIPPLTTDRTGPKKCATTPDSLLESGEHVSTGKKPFDAFFDQVAELRDKVAGFDSDLFPVREPLTDEMKLDVDIAMADLIATVQKRATKLRDFGVTLNLRITPEPKLLSARGKLEVDERDGNHRREKYQREEERRAGDRGTGQREEQRSQRFHQRIAG